MGVGVGGGGGVGIIRYTRVKDFRFRRGQIKTGYTGNEAEVKLIMFSLKTSPSLNVW